VREIELAQLS